MIQMLCYNSKDLSDEEKLVLKGFMKSHFQWWHWMEDTIMFETDRTIDQTTNLLLKLLKDTHFLLVEVSSEYSGWLPSKAWNWINDKLKPEGWILERKYRLAGMPQMVELFGDMEILNLFGESIGRERTVAFEYPKKPID